ncbi:hypothetical protein [Leptolyngbya ohadii]|uniref:hypothetical protein n=1 Tax=Leptolyngbya ohadii TaxID=1962290 RepID=UPI000B5A0B6F|nr:hypothetical protein [Leptolyngbya ohadii]
MVNCEPLKAPLSWRGKLYLKGCTSIPEDLAAALGILPAPEPGREGDPATNPPPASTETEAPPQATAAEKPKRTRKR